MWKANGSGQNALKSIPLPQPHIYISTFSTRYDPAGKMKWLFLVQNEMILCLPTTVSVFLLYEVLKQSEWDPTPPPPRNPFLLMSGRQSEEWEWTPALWQIKHFICRRLCVRIETLKREFGCSRLMFATLTLPNGPRLAGWASKLSIRFRDWIEACLSLSLSLSP